MPTRLLTDDIWRRISKLARRCKKARVAVAYLAKHGAQRLPLREGSLLVVDFSTHAVASGQTDPREILKLIRNGVEVHSVENLHAKVFALGDRLIVGSTNVSESSATGLVEAAIETTDRAACAGGAAFVESLRGDHVGPAHARAMAKNYKEPKRDRGGGGRRGRRSAPIPTQSKVWLVPLVVGSWDEEDYAAAEAARPSARRKMRFPRSSDLDEFMWHDSSATLFEGIALGQRIIQVVADGGKMAVLPPGRVVRLHKYRRGKRRGLIAFLELPKNRARNLRYVQRRLGAIANPLAKLKNAGRLVKDPQLLYALSALWPTAKWS